MHAMQLADILWCLGRRKGKGSPEAELSLERFGRVERGVRTATASLENALFTHKHSHVFQRHELPGE
jgi:hypothetical protein